MKYICRDCGKPTNNIQIICNSEIHVCDDCLNQIHRKIKWKSENEHWHEDIIICPYCDYEQYTSLYNEEDYYTVECPSCGKKFNLEVEEVRYLSTKRNVAEMPEDWNGDEK